MTGEGEAGAADVERQRAAQTRHKWEEGQEQKKRDEDSERGVCRPHTYES